MKDTATQARRIGRYVLGDVLGRGAMGIVYKAEDPLIARTVAIKLLHITRALSPEQAAIVRERFLREAQTAGNLDHPNIVRVLDVGCDDETAELYLVMEFLPGTSLEAVLQEQEGNLARERICELVRQIGSALDAAHARGVIHRDVKPANILFADGNTAKIADFGIARIASSHLTQDMRDLGTPVYMSPEQVTGKPLDGRADLFSLGVIAYHLLTGSPPFSGKNPVSVAYQIVHSTPPLPSSILPDLPPGIDRVMSRILAKDPDERYGSGREFHEDFSRVLMGLPADTKTAKANKPWRGALDPRLLSVVGIALVTAGVLWSPHEVGRATVATNQPARASVAAPREAASVLVPAPARLDSPKPAAVPTKSVPAAPGTSPKPPKPAPARAAKLVPDAAPVEQAPSLPAAGEPHHAAESGDAVADARSESASEPKLPPPEPRKGAPARSKLNVRLGHFIQAGTLVLSLDGSPLLSEKFAKRNRLMPYQNSEWQGISVPVGRHTLRARVESAKGKVATSEPFEVEIGADGATELRLVIKDDAVVVKNSD